MRRGRTGGGRRHHCYTRDGKLLALGALTVSIIGAQSLLMGQQPAPSASPVEVAAAANEGTPASTRLEQVVVTGYVVPRVGIGPAPVVTLDQDYIRKQGDQTVADVVLRLPLDVGSFYAVGESGSQLFSRGFGGESAGFRYQFDSCIDRWAAPGSLPIPAEWNSEFRRSQFDSVGGCGPYRGPERWRQRKVWI